MFDEVPSTVDFPAMERGILAFWSETHAFDKLVAKNHGKAKWAFLDGPITANNPMGVHHAWGRTYKDLFQRYKAMQGYDQRYQNGFDCQGLWVEVEVEKELGFTSKRDIEQYGIDRFVQACKDRVLRFSQMQTEQSIRLGYWMDWDNSYYTMSDENNYTIWLFLKKCHERGLIYHGYDAMPWCPRCSTGISQHEIATEGYEEVTHTSIFLKFPLVDRPGESLLVWTTTPWTLAANVAVAVHPDLVYQKVHQGDEVLYVAKGAKSSAVRGPHDVIEELPGAQLVGMRYRGPFDELPAVQRAGAVEAHRVIAGKDVVEAEGTGIVHIAPGCGREDFVLGREHDLPAIVPIDEFGNYVEGFGVLTGRNAQDVARDVVDSLQAKGLLYRAEPYTHRYPVCWRCHAELVFRLVDEWFISMDGPKGRPPSPPGSSRPVMREGETARGRDGASGSTVSPSRITGRGGEELPPLREQIMAVAKKIRWLPSWGLDRELDWLRNMDDWMISKKRYWGLALPIWTCATCDWFDVVGGEDELKQRAVAGWDAFEGHTPHRPWIDAVKIACPTCGGQAARIPDVGNPWLDAGIVPYSTLHYRHNRDYWMQWFPADFISESFPGQFRNWFYALLTMSTVLEDREPFRTVLGYALVRDEQGREMHKSWGNAIEFNEAAERIGASVMRWMYVAANPETNLNFGYTIAEDVKRRLLVLWNVYAFFCTYARLDRFDPTRIAVDPPSRPALDRWILGELHALLQEATRRYGDFDAMTATRRIEAFVDDLSTWYVRRGRPRYWKSEADQDKAAAYLTLWEVLVALAKMLAPSMPFLAETMYQNLVRRVDAHAPESVHHCDWPKVDPALIDDELRRAMAHVRQIVGLGRAARSTSKIKVRQPLPALLVRVKNERERQWLQSLADQVTDELNVKRLAFVEDTSALVSYEIKPSFKLLGPRFGPRANTIAKALQSANPAQLVQAHAAGEPVSLVVDGLELEIPPEDYDVETVAREGFVIVEERDSTVALDTRLTPELVDEGLARELVHRLNTMRKDAGFRLEDRIETVYQADPELAAVFERFGDYIRQETLSLRLQLGVPEDSAFRRAMRLDGHDLLLGIKRAAPAAAPMA
ncbi:MAG: isoleucine--tRNA ligase [Chloroflexi bacterium]|nr:isoleucine--tRNA ligase [Chloroflexota bacterium]